MNWISVKDKLPEDLQDVLFSNTGIEDWKGISVPPSTHCGWYSQSYFFSWLDPRDKWTATHWMPLPEPPK